MGQELYWLCVCMELGKTWIQIITEFHIKNYIYFHFLASKACIFYKSDNGRLKYPDLYKYSWKTDKIFLFLSISKLCSFQAVGSSKWDSRHHETHVTFCYIIETRIMKITNIFFTPSIFIYFPFENTTLFLYPCGDEGSQILSGEERSFKGRLMFRAP